MKLSIIIPVYNEEEVIEELYKRVRASLSKDFKKWDYEMIFVDDGSSDKTYKKLESLHKENKRIKVFQFSRNFGQHTAISAGLKNTKGDFIVVMDADLQDRPEEIINLYKKLKTGYNLVYSVRRKNNNSLFKNFTSRVFWFSISFLTGLNIPANQSMLKIFDKKILSAVNQLDDINPFYPAIFSLVGFSQGICIVRNDRRFKGKTKYSIYKMVQMATNAILGYAYKRLSYIYFMIIFIFIFFLIIFMLGYNNIFHLSQSNFLLIIMCTILLLVFISIFYINISYYYFSKIFKNMSKTPNYIINNKLV